MFIWDEYRWAVYVALVIFAIILWDEWAYNAWKKANPGAMYSHLMNKTIPLVDPSNPPFTTIP